MTSRPAKYRARCCNECGASYTPHRCDELFCSTKCRKDWNNRAMVRGAELYHFFMAHRYERDAAKEIGAMGFMTQIAQRWHDQDKTKRAGRKTWYSPKRMAEKH